MAVSLAPWQTSDQDYQKAGCKAAQRSLMGLLSIRPIAALRSRFSLSWYIRDYPSAL